MLRRRQARGFIWLAGAAMAVAAAASWWSALEDGSGGADIVAPIGFTVAALIWFANGIVGKLKEEATEGDHR